MPEATLFGAGLVVDGSGGPSWPGDVLVSGDRIVAVGAGLRKRFPDGMAMADVQLVDCRGQVIAPGFMDAHTHDDAIVLHAPEYLAKLSQGITTGVTGNCGISLAPYRTAQALPPLTLLGAGSFRYPTMAAYRDAVQAARPALNVAALVGHTTLRFATMPGWPAPRTPTNARRWPRCSTQASPTARTACRRACSTKRRIPPRPTK